MLDPTTRLAAAREGRYHVERQLGDGRMETVYVADVTARRVVRMLDFFEELERLAPN